MVIRAINPNDLPQLKLIHDKHFKDQFDFPNFLNNYLCAYLVEDDDGNIIVGGGVKTIAESVVITNMDLSVRERMMGLQNIQQINQYICNKFNYNELHAFVQNDDWAHHLTNVGFNPVVGKCLVLSF